MSRLARIAISIGDPAGIGAEIALKALQDQSAASLAHWLLIADAAALNAAARVCGIDPAALLCTLVETGTLAADHAAALTHVGHSVPVALTGGFGLGFAGGAAIALAAGVSGLLVPGRARRPDSGRRTRSPEVEEAVA